MQYTLISSASQSSTLNEDLDSLRDLQDNFSDVVDLFQVLKANPQRVRCYNICVCVIHFTDRLQLIPEDANAEEQIGVLLEIAQLRT